MSSDTFTYPTQPPSQPPWQPDQRPTQPPWQPAQPAQPAQPTQWAAQPPTRPARRRWVSVPVLVGTSIVLTGLLAGVYYGWAVSVMPGLRQSSDRTAVEALWQMNRAIQNLVFFLSFLGAPAISLWLLIRARRGESSTALRWIIAGFALNLLGLFISFAFNIPLNNALDKAGNPAHHVNYAATRHHFEHPWVAWNIVRTVVTTAAVCCLARVAFLRSRTA